MKKLLILLLSLLTMGCGTPLFPITIADSNVQKYFSVIDEETNTLIDKSIETIKKALGDKQNLIYTPGDLTGFWTDKNEYFVLKKSEKYPYAYIMLNLKRKGYVLYVGLENLKSEKALAGFIGTVLNIEEKDGTTKLKSASNVYEKISYTEVPSYMTGTDDLTTALTGFKGMLNMAIIFLPMKDI